MTALFEPPSTLYFFGYISTNRKLQQTNKEIETVIRKTRRGEKIIPFYNQSPRRNHWATAGKKTLRLQRQLKPRRSIPFPFTESVVSAAFYMKNVAQRGPLNLFSVHIRPRHDSAAQIDALRWQSIKRRAFLISKMERLSVANSGLFGRVMRGCRCNILEPVYPERTSSRHLSCAAAERERRRFPPSGHAVN